MWTLLCRTHPSEKVLGVLGNEKSFVLFTFLVFAYFSSRLP